MVRKEPVFPYYLKLLKERSKAGRLKLFSKYDRVRLQRIRNLACSRRRKVYEPQFLLKNIDGLVEQLNKFFLSGGGGNADG